MCGIAGLVDLRDKRPVNDRLLRAMSDSLLHRGPDASGTFCKPGVGLSHRRLSIIDLASGQQPMLSADGRFTLVYNGELYNYRELREELMKLGRRFRTKSDTEVLLQCWETWGEDCLPRLNGMFAFAIWNQETSELYLARDPIGIKPLYYALLPDGWLAFGSELKALQRCPDLPRELDPRAVEDYFTFGYIPDPKTIYAGVFKLPPAHALRCQRGKPTPPPRRYWALEFSRNAGTNIDVLQRELLERFDSAVQRQMVADVPLGAFLSGGVDSSAVVASMAMSAPDPVSTCSIGFADPQYNEANYAAIVAKRYATNHDCRIVSADDFSLADSLIALYDEPFADSSALPTYRVCELARSKVKVALSGDGGDECYAGYRRYLWHMREEQVRSVLPLAVRSRVFGWLGRHYPKLDRAPRVFRAKTTFESLAMSSATAYLHSVSIFPAELRARLFSKRMATELQCYRSHEVFAEHARNGPQDSLSLIQYLDFQTYLPGDILTKVDRASMAHSLEVRVPILDRELVDWAASVSTKYRIKNGEGKYLLKRAFEPRLPRQILYRAKKGFAVPVEDWFRGPLRQAISDTVAGGRLAATGLFEVDELKRLVREHQSGRSNYTPVLWALYMFDGFMRREADGRS